MNVWVVPSAYLTVNVWLAWLPLTASPRNWSEAYWPAGRLMVCPVALTTLLEPAAPMVKGVPFQVWLVPSRLAERAAAPPSMIPVVRVNVEPSLTMPSRLNEPPRFTCVSAVTAAVGVAETSFDLPLSPPELTAVTS